jgi:hypothetical protein
VREKGSEDRERAREVRTWRHCGEGARDEREGREGRERERDKEESIEIQSELKGRELREREGQKWMGWMD